MTEADPTYPYVRCQADQVIALGYAVCRHVLSLAAIEQYQAATTRDLGLVLCGVCAVGPELPPVADLILCCEQCVERILNAHARAVLTES